jgi:ribonuclease VapC
MFVDASAIVAIVALEPEAATLAEALDGASSPITSSIAVYEAALGLCRKKRASVEAAQAQIHNFLREAGIRLVAIAPDASDGALDAFSRYGKGRGHRAQLNMGDCFAYAVAKAHGTSLLFKGEDFSLTDIAAAAPKPPSAH